MMDFANFIYSLVFWVCGLTLLLSAVVVILSQNPVHAVLFLILAFFNAAGLFMLAGAEFLSLLLIVVYVGAVMVLFLFVVMMLNIKKEKGRSFFSAYFMLGCLVGAILLIEMLLVIFAYLLPLNHATNTSTTATPFLNMAMGDGNNIQSLGQLLYTDYFVAFQTAGLVLLVAMVAAILLTLRRRPGVKKQTIWQQNIRRDRDDLKMVSITKGAGGRFPPINSGRFVGRLADGTQKKNKKK